MRPCTPGLESVGPDQATVAGVVAAASDGDVICLAAGSAEYTSQVEITNGGTTALEIRGHGSLVSPWGSAGETIITVHGSSVFGGFEVAGSPYYPTVSNIRFLFDSGTPPHATAVGNSVGAGAHNPWIIHHNDFFSGDTTAQGCNVLGVGIGSGHGLIYRNKFTSQALAGCGYGMTNTKALDIRLGAGSVASWKTPHTMGDADSTGLNNVYFETNYVSGFLAVDASPAARLVWRFNDVHCGSVVTHGFDSGEVGLRHAEVYNTTFYCDGGDSLGHSVAMSSWIGVRGGTAKIFGNIFPATDTNFCGFGGGTLPALAMAWYKAEQCAVGTAGWPGEYPDTYPVTQLPGWGWIDGSTTVGASTAQGQPGGAGFTQDREPIYLFNNTNNTGIDLAYIRTGYAGECHAMAYSNTSKVSDTKLVIPSGSAGYAPYVNSGQLVLAFFTDLVGGPTAPTISDDCNGGQSWTERQGGTSGSMRLKAWTAVFNATCVPTITFTHDSSSAARSGTVIVVRGVESSPIDANPAVLSDSSSTYTSNNTGTLNQTNELVLGYFALNGPGSDANTAGSGFLQPTSCTTCSQPYNIGIAGTTGDAADTNVTIATVYQTVTADTSIPATLTNVNDRAGLAGVITVKALGNNNAKFTLQNTDLIESDREFYTQVALPGGASLTSGATQGTRAQMDAITTCDEGVGFWVTNEGSWNDDGESGSLYTCDASNNWVLSYTPYDYPHPLATETGETVPTEPPSGAHRALITF